ncbi:hypothetical protein [Deminuibacter soli]|uniref:Uncharacterized protein n=1 Tax=Deminuibacter soli TaxID=2291815 RepID=A0A3E1NLT8_9BACT|nr:hypothetical protein [Deminuibacter soli]RFM28899.1 hypothetical protein DXN05_09025 [Deminuibacter soli]
MKKIILAAIIAISLTATAFAGTTNDKVSTTFKKAWPAASITSWKVNGMITTISFTVDNLNMQAFYDEEGNFMGTSRPVQLTELPAAAQTTIKDKYQDYTATEAIEMNSTTAGFNYYVSLEKDTQKLILQVAQDGSVKTFKKLRK